MWARVTLQCLMASRLPLEVIILPPVLKILFDGCLFALMFSSWYWRSSMEHICSWTWAYRCFRAKFVPPDDLDFVASQGRGIFWTERQVSVMNQNEDVWVCSVHQVWR
jgi:hypothetical protein